MTDQKSESQDLKVEVAPEKVKVADVGSPSQPLYGVVAILDALGAAVYSREEANEFLNARDAIMKLMVDVALDNFKVDKNDLKIFTFNDSIIITYVRKAKDLTTNDINSFCGLLRSFEVSFLLKRILFRGAVSVGELYRVDPATNTVMGPAVSDAAAWYECADWIGINLTPRASILVGAGLQDSPSALDHVMIDYPVPFKGGVKKNLKAINWPKGFFMSHGRESKRAKAALLSILGGMRSIPAGSESKYTHAIEFYEDCEGKTFVKPSSTP